jgi:RimJ/RimL family protein N-acetyltransferase
MGEWSAMPAELATERIHLGAWRAADADDLMALVNERTTAGPVNGRPDRDEVNDRLKCRLSELADTGIALYALRLDDAFAGYCGLIVGRASLDEPEIAYELPARFRGRGLATEAAHAVVAAAARTGRLRLWATVRSWNDASFRVLDRVGFARSGRVTTDEFGELVWCTRRL